MKDLSSFSVKVQNFKCFGKSEQGFDTIKPINIIVGRNSSGKSTLLDLIEYTIQGNLANITSDLWHGDQRPSIIFESPLTEKEIKKLFVENTREGKIPGDHWQFGKRFVGTKLRWSISAAETHFISIGNCLDGSRPFDKINNPQDYLNGLATAKENLLLGKQFRRLSAERNINPEIANSQLTVRSDGIGATNIIQNFLNEANLPSDLVETTLLNDLNTIMEGDAKFTDIACQHSSNNNWEIYLKEDSKGRIPLSQTGSGLKTIILVLVYINLLPVVSKIKISDFVFGFEELENCLHPALLRRLLSYISEQAKAHGCIFFLTTHSNVAIDLFSKNPDAQILHVTHNGEQANVRTVKTYIDNKGILDDLDVRASDLLQSNGIIWVEGPSDRIYLNRWISLWSGNQLSEGNHYQCVFYGGRLLSHLSSSEPALVEESVSMLRVNKNAIILMDSDKASEEDSLNKTKKRILEGIKDTQGTAWITQGREIENYIPTDALQLLLGKKGISQVKQYEGFFDYLDEIEKGKGKYYAERKPLLAEQLAPHMSKENISPVLDLSQKLDEICCAIRKWNNLK